MRAGSGGVHILVAGHSVLADGEAPTHGLTEHVAAQVLALAGNYRHLLFPACGISGTR